MGESPAPHASTILLIEDDPGVSEALCEVLRDEGYKVVPAMNGLEGLQWLKSNPAPCLILLDLMMPVMDGYQFRARQTQDPLLAAIPVLVLSAGTLKDRVDGLGTAGVFAKPINLTSLLATIEQHC